MKKVLSLIAIAGLAASVVACGPSKEEQEKAAKAKEDSARIADSTAKAAELAAAAEKAAQDSIANAERAKFVADSLHQDSITKKLIKPAKK